jgi:hypothetical protein
VLTPGDIAAERAAIEADIDGTTLLTAFAETVSARPARGRPAAPGLRGDLVRQPLGGNDRRLRGHARARHPRVHLQHRVRRAVRLRRRALRGDDGDRRANRLPQLREIILIGGEAAGISRWAQVLAQSRSVAALDGRLFKESWQQAAPGDLAACSRCCPRCIRPRWSRSPRFGKLHAAVLATLPDASPELVSAMPDKARLAVLTTLGLDCCRAALSGAAPLDEAVVRSSARSACRSASPGGCRSCPTRRR